MYVTLVAQNVTFFYHDYNRFYRQRNLCQTDKELHSGPQEPRWAAPFQGESMAVVGRSHAGTGKLWPSALSQALWTVRS